MPPRPDDRMAIDAGLVRRLVATQFPRWAGLPVAPVPAGGWDNHTFRLGDDMSVRLPSAARYAAQVGKEHEWLPRLAPHLPLAVPHPLAIGEPAEGYPWRWSIRLWRDGETASAGRIADMAAFAKALAGFLTALQDIDPSGGPAPGEHNFHRGGHLSVYDGEVRQALRELDGDVDGDLARSIWGEALAAQWRRAPVWVHGDIDAGNLLVRDGRLRAVIDFGSCAVGDPACDLAISWTFFDARARRAFRAALAPDAQTWARARGWALWKALITLAGHGDASPRGAAARRTIGALSGDRRAISRQDRG